MISIIQNNDVYEVRFNYNPAIIALVKNTPGRAWNAEGKFWTVPNDHLGFLLNQLKGTEFESQINLQSTEHINQNASIDCTTNIPDIDISNIPFYIKKGCEPFQHQLDFMKWAISRNTNTNAGFILGDDPGLGKTIEIINFALYGKQRYNYKHCLVICCVNSSKYNWKDEVSTHTNGQYSGYILGTRLKRNSEIPRYDTGSKEKLQDLTTGHMYGDTTQPELPYFIILNIEAIRYKEGRKYLIADMITKLINENHINIVAIDEVHKNTSPSSCQGKQLLHIKKSTRRAAQWIPMTGTPIISKPTDVFLPLKLIDGHSYDSYYMWCKQFCVYGGFNDFDIISYKNIPQLKQMLQSNMIRRLKSEVLDLPPKMRYTEYVELTPYQSKLSTKISNELEDNAEEIIHSMNPMVKLLKLRQAYGSPELVDSDCIVDEHYIKKNCKLQRLLELLSDIHERNEKVIVFSNWVEPLRTLYRFISTKYKTCCFTGTMKDADRQKHKSVFINNPEYTVMLGTIGAMGTTHTFTVAQNIIFYDEPWTAVDKQQAEDRAHRIGTTQSLNIYTILAANTIDERVHDIVYGKQLISNYIVDNKLDIRNNPAMFHKLLGNN